MGRGKILLAAAAALVAACATGTLGGDDASNKDASTTKDATTDGTSSQDSGKSDGPLADGATCNSPLTKCVADAGALCVDTKSDPGHCGSCTNACTTGDAGSLAPGSNNPDAGIPFDGGYDGGIGWSLGTADCDAGGCGIACPQGLSECGDRICYDPQNFHDHCGDCNTACASTEWCTQGHCCSQGTAYCNGACTDIFGDKNNCGSCGNVCGSGTPVCSGGVCSSATVYSQSFTTNVIASAQCTAWTTFQTALTGTYTSITIKGSLDTTGRTCTGAGANTLCQALHNKTTVASLACGGYTWNVDSTCGSGTEITADGLTCSCTPNPDYSVRPCIGSTVNWGAINSAACPPPTQTITVTCQ